MEDESTLPIGKGTQRSMSATENGADTKTNALTKEQSTMIGLFFGYIARKKIDILVEQGGRVSYVDEEVASLEFPTSVAEVTLYGEVTWHDKI